MISAPRNVRRRERDHRPVAVVQLVGAPSPRG
jgi:hypothetical protein